MKWTLLRIALLLSCGVAHAQAPGIIAPETGFPPFGSFEPGGFDTVNLQNLNVHFTVDIMSSPGRGLTLAQSLDYDSAVWRIKDSGGAPSWDPHPDWGWKGDLLGDLTWSQTIIDCGDICTPEGCIPNTVARWEGYAYTDPNGTVHSFGVQSGFLQCDGDPPYQDTGFATDNSGYYIDVSSPLDPVVYTLDGTAFRDNNSGPGGGPIYRMTDRNGNYLGEPETITDGVQWRDTRGQVALQILDPDSTTRQYRFRDTSGGWQDVTVTYQNLPIQTDFACPSVAEYSGAALLPVTIALPNGRSYTFEYEQTTGGASSGRISSVTLPTGGKYDYAHGAVDCEDASLLTLTRDVTESAGNTSTWTYTRTEMNPSINRWRTRVRHPKLPYDAVANEVDVTFTGGREGRRKYFDGLAGGSILRDVQTVYDPDNTPNRRLITLEDGSKTKIHLDYDDRGRLVEIRHLDWGAGVPGPYLRGVQYDYIEIGNVRDLVSEIRVRQNNINGHVAARTVFGYDTTPLSCVAGAAQHDDAAYGCGFTARGNLTEVTKYEDAHNLTGAITRRFHYDSVGNTTSAELDCCQERAWTFSQATEWSFPDAVISGDDGGPQLTTSYTYNVPTGQVETSTDPNGQLAVFTYDSMGRLLDVERPDGEHVTFIRDDAARIVKVDSPIDVGQRERTIREFDGLGRLIRQSRTNPQENTVYTTVETAYDVLGRRAKSRNPMGFWTETFFDALDRPIKVIPPDGSAGANHTRYVYAGTTMTVTDPVGNQIRYQHDPLGQLRRVYEPDVANPSNLDQVTEYQYTTLGQLAIVDQGSDLESRIYSYDDLGRQLVATTPEAGTENYTYQANGLMETLTDARGVVTSFAYDGLNRLTQITYDVGNTGVTPTDPVTFLYGTRTTYNENGRLIRMTDGTGWAWHAYDTLGRLVSLTKRFNDIPGGPKKKNKTIRYGYNLAGQVSSIEYPSGRIVAYSRDEIGRVTDVISDQTTILAGVQYNEASFPTSLVYGNGVSATFTYSPDRLQLTAITHESQGQTLQALSYAYDLGSGNNGQIRGIVDVVDPNRSVSYAYDALGRIGSASTATWSLSWAYDRFGNRTSQSGSGDASGLTGNRTFDHKNRIVGFSYDASGNVTWDGTHNLIHDAARHLTEVGGFASYAYDGNGVRIENQTGSETTFYVFSGPRVIAEYDGSGNLEKEYVYRNRQRVATHEGSDTLYHHDDHLSNRLTTADAGGVVAESGHFPFGERWYSIGDSGKWVFTTYERDVGTEYDYAMARYHDSALGRFHTPDLKGGATGDPQTLNRYVYVANDPVNTVDPTGLERVRGEFYRSPKPGSGRGGGGWNIDMENGGLIGDGVDMPIYYRYARDNPYGSWDYEWQPGTCRTESDTEEDPETGELIPVDRVVCDDEWVWVFKPKVPKVTFWQWAEIMDSTLDLNDPPDPIEVDCEGSWEVRNKTKAFYHCICYWGCESCGDGPRLYLGDWNRYYQNPTFGVQWPGGGACICEAPGTASGCDDQTPVN